MYLTIDRWTNVAAYHAFLTAWDSDYRALDEQSRVLAAREVKLGTIETDGDVWLQ